MDIEPIRRSLPICCDIAGAPVESYSDSGRAMISQFLPEARTVVVTAHHVLGSLEWAWFPFVPERGGSTCAADLHAKSVIESILFLLRSNGYRGYILPYPSACGISFKRLAAGTCLGEMGDSFLFLHRKWGPWVHLRVLLTDATLIDQQTDQAGVCKHCGRCVGECPGKALSEGYHSLQACGTFQQAERDRLAIRAAYRPKCEVCARVCPTGDPPAALDIKDREEEKETL